MIFAKNSDREPNEAHEVVIIPAGDHPDGSQVQCTYTSIPQVNHTYSVLLARPFWIWGAEMGANEHGVVIGNEAVFTKIPVQKEGGLIGMDFIRLALERSKSAGEALGVMIDLLETHGQGGNCGFQHSLYYHNSYLLADQKEAWVLETAGQHWAAEQVKDIRSISNALTIGDHWDAASKDLVSYAIERGWCKSRADFNFARCYSDWLYTPLSAAAHRQSCSTRLMKNNKGKISPKTMMSILRSHGEEDGRVFAPDRGVTGSQVCMHAGFGPVRGSQSTGSMVSRIGPDLVTHWLTGSAAPCTSIFKPVWLDSGLPKNGLAPTGKFHPEALFWQHEKLHRAVLENYSQRLPAYQQARDQLEAGYLAEEEAARTGSPEERLVISEKCFERAEEATNTWLKMVKEFPARRNQLLFDIAWKRFNQQAEITIDHDL